MKVTRGHRKRTRTNRTRAGVLKRRMRQTVLCQKSIRKKRKKTQINNSEWTRGKPAGLEKKITHNGRPPGGGHSSGKTALASLARGERHQV